MYLVSTEVLNGTRKQSSLTDYNGDVHHEHIERGTHCYCYSKRQQSRPITAPASVQGRSQVPINHHVKCFSMLIFRLYEDKQQ